MEVLPHSGERGTKKKPYYSQRRNKRNVRKREGDTTAKLERNDNRKERLCKFWASGNCVKGDRCPFCILGLMVIVSPPSPLSRAITRELTYSINVSCELSLKKYNY
ncbi:hypothetical protein TIFTF001_046583 [Ficus carica]|uniref:C3H1-type domain-containing protein n=1 Tax=Ficus carica TaxID=3494 RepID=A0AA87ZGH4_FICCA|nr:hypothetical protein TIFTF001_046583 [Ficus carica]